MESVERPEAPTTEQISEQSTSNFNRGETVWLTGLEELPTINGSDCKVLKYDRSTQRYEVRRICTNEKLRVRRENLMNEDPNGVGAVAWRLTEDMNGEISDKIPMESTCQLCWRALAPGSVCQVDHSIS